MFLSSIYACNDSTPYKLILPINFQTVQFNLKDSAICEANFSKAMYSGEIDYINLEYGFANDSLAKIYIYGYEFSDEYDPSNIVGTIKEFHYSMARRYNELIPKAFLDTSFNSAQIISVNEVTIYRQFNKSNNCFILFKTANTYLSIYFDNFKNQKELNKIVQSIRIK
jgi:hypothetical protein